MSQKLKRQSLRAPAKSGHPQCARKESGSLRSRSQCTSMCGMPTLPLACVPDPDDLVASISRTIPNSELATIARRTNRNFKAKVQFRTVSPSLRSASRGQMRDCGLPRVSLRCGGCPNLRLVLHVCQVLHQLFLLRLFHEFVSPRFS